MKQFSIESVKKLAKLARLNLNPDEEIQMAKEMSSILEYVEKLNEVDTEGVEPTAQVTGLINVTREDIVSVEEDLQRGLMDNVPHTKDGYIKVKRVMGDK